MDLKSLIKSLLSKSIWNSDLPTMIRLTIGLISFIKLWRKSRSIMLALIPGGKELMTTLIWPGKNSRKKSWWPHKIVLLPASWRLKAKLRNKTYLPHMNGMIMEWFPQLKIKVHAEEIGGKETDWRNWWGWLYGGWINQRRII